MIVRILLKGVSNDLDFKDKNRISAVNSINWGRIIAQIVYYFKGYFSSANSSDGQLMSQFHQETLAISVLAIYPE